MIPVIAFVVSLGFCAGSFMAITRRRRIACALACWICAAVAWADVVWWQR